MTSHLTSSVHDVPVLWRLTWRVGMVQTSWDSETGMWIVRIIRTSAIAGIKCLVFIFNRQRIPTNLFVGGNLQIEELTNFQFVSYSLPKEASYS